MFRCRITQIQQKARVSPRKSSNTGCVCVCGCSARGSLKEAASSQKHSFTCGFLHQCLTNSLSRLLFSTLEDSLDSYLEHLLSDTAVLRCVNNTRCFWEEVNQIVNKFLYSLHTSLISPPASQKLLFTLCGIRFVPTFWDFPNIKLHFFISTPYFCLILGRISFKMLAQMHSFGWDLGVSSRVGSVWF